MAEYLIQDTTLTNIAAPIKTLMGLTDNLTTDEMVSNLNDANTAVANALVALTEKEVVVPNGSNVTDLAALIAAIEAGGTKVSTGTLTPASNKYSTTIMHALSVVPTVFINYTDKSFGKTYSTQFILAQNTTMSNGKRTIYVYNLSGTANIVFGENLITDEASTSNFVDSATVDSIRIGSQNYAPLNSGITYSWIAIG